MTMGGKQVVDKMTRGLERGWWTMQWRVVEVAVLQPIRRCNGETTRRHNHAADTTGRHRDNAADWTPQQCGQRDDATM